MKISNNVELICLQKENCSTSYCQINSIKVIICFLSMQLLNIFFKNVKCWENGAVYNCAFLVNLEQNKFPTI